MGTVSEAVVVALGDTILVEVGLRGFDLSARAANDLILDKPLKHLVPIHSKRLDTTGIKMLTITLKYKHTMEDAALGFFRSSLHKLVLEIRVSARAHVSHRDTSLFASGKEYLAIEKGWFSPYLFASSRRPIIPRVMTPD